MKNHVQIAWFDLFFTCSNTGFQTVFFRLTGPTGGLVHLSCPFLVFENYGYGNMKLFKEFLSLKFKHYAFVRSI